MAITDNEPLPDGQDGEERPADAEAPAGVSLTEDILALLEDGKTYLEAEKAFQKSRAAFVADKGKRGVVRGLAAFAMIHLALIGMVVGLVIALSPLLTVWGAIAAVTGVLLVGGIVLTRSAINQFRAAGRSFGDDGK
ncbi:phage holin family protein [Pelagerythrobacter marensis]|uniref:Phage holin family protein n=1 Tax=Pelagerythrobacter marensis TaxID=543877 RepID=A0ABZ2D536_9SPHN